MDERHRPGEGNGLRGAGRSAARVRRVESSVVIALTGDIDLISESDTRAAVDDAVALLPAAGHPDTGPSNAASVKSRPTDAGGPVLVMDLNAVTFFSSTGLQLVVAAARAAANRGVEFRVATGTERSVLRTLSITGVDTIVSTFITCEEALTGHSQGVTADGLAQQHDLGSGPCAGGDGHLGHQRLHDRDAPAPRPERVCAVVLVGSPPAVITDRHLHPPAPLRTHVLRHGQYAGAQAGVVLHLTGIADRAQLLPTWIPELVARFDTFPTLDDAIAALDEIETIDDGCANVMATP